MIKYTLSVKKRIIIIFVVIGIISVSAGAASVFVSREQEKAQQKVKEDTAFISTLQKSLIDYERWKNELLEAVTMDNEFTGTLEPELSTFGQYHQSLVDKGSFKDIPNDIRNLVSGIISTNITLFEKAKMLVSFIETDKSNAIYLYNSGIVPYVNDIHTTADELINVIELQMDNNLQHAQSLTLRFNIVLLSTIIIVLFGLLAAGYFIIKSIVSPLAEAKKHLNKLSTGDFTSKMNNKYLNRHDEFGEIARTISTMQTSLTNIIENITTASKKLFTSSQELSAVGQQSSAASEEVSRTIEQIAKSTQEQANEAETGVFAANELSGLIKEDLNNILIVVERLNALRELKDNGLDAVNQLIDKTSQSSISINEVQDVIKKTNTSVEKIGDATRIISNIESRTNLLSLNASIEAARAGEAGLGFSVVAEEIRKLAEQSSNSVKEINSALSILFDDSRNTVEIMEKVHKIINEQTEHVNDTEDKYIKIADAIESIGVVIEKSSESVNTMEVKKNDFIEVIQNLSAISEENAASTQEVSASVEEQTASVEEISNSSENLTTLAEELQKSISKFKY